jgi:Raf kinase inhibitor-like YbhB/YbcL family protein
MWRVAHGTALALLATAVACSGSGGKASKTTTSAAPTAQVRLTSPAFTDGGAIPRQYTCDGANQSPPLAWSGVASGTQSLALVMEDPDVPGKPFVHWTVSGIPPSTTSLASGQVPPGATQGSNGSGSTGYTGPCPPSGQTHHYVFALEAVAGPTIRALAQLRGTYGR